MKQLEERLEDLDREYANKRENIAFRYEGHMEEVKRRLADLDEDYTIRKQRLLENYVRSKGHVLQPGDTVTLRVAKDPTKLINEALADGIITQDEADTIWGQHRAFSREADIALMKLLQKHGTMPKRQPAPVIHPSDPSISYSMGEPEQLNIVDYGPIFAAFEDFGAWFLHPRRRNKLIWMAIVVPAIVICLMELL